MAKAGGMENGDGAQQSKEKVTRKERVTETFMDSDGFMGKFFLDWTLGH